MTSDESTKINGWNFEGEHVLGAGPRSWTTYGWAPGNNDDLPEIEVTVRDRAPYTGTDDSLAYPRRIATGIGAWLSLTGEFEKGQGKFLTLEDPVAPYPSLLELADIVRSALLNAGSVRTQRLPRDQVDLNTAWVTIFMQPTRSLEPTILR